VREKESARAIESQRQRTREKERESEREREEQLRCDRRRVVRKRVLD